MRIAVTRCIRVGLHRHIRAGNALPAVFAAYIRENMKINVGNEPQLNECNERAEKSSKFHAFDDFITNFDLPEILTTPFHHHDD